MDRSPVDLASGPARAALACARARTAVAALLLGVTVPRAAGAHPFGTASVNRYLGAELTPRGVHLAYLLDFGELPAVAEVARLDADRDGRVTPTERERYLQARVPAFLSTLSVRVDGASVTPRIEFRALDAPAGEGGLPTLRVTAELYAPVAGALAPGRTVRVQLEDHGYRERAGWREIRADDSSLARLITASAVPDAAAARARTPLRMDRAALAFRVRGAAPETPTRPRLRPALLALLAASSLLVSALVVRRRARRHAQRPPAG